MKREDWSVPALLAEAVCLILEAAYLVLQIYCGLEYQIPPQKWLLNIAMSLLSYAVFTLLAIYPEKINRLPVELCRGLVRQLSVRMVRIIKLVFVAGLIIPSVADAFGVRILDAYSILVMGAILLVAVYYELRILKILKGMQ
ncbi:MAG: hypothetical protein NC180_03035 [Muribaculaceae bacterium]|nr:hypothetical protein [Roseburia sp.]MCM1430115.1 hypothetical protein [Muribaculaceae bacterium]MCM1492180.1 hypothetical protein [Muribaculaceae bacterium]